MTPATEKSEELRSILLLNVESALHLYPRPLRYINPCQKLVSGNVDAGIPVGTIFGVFEDFVGVAVCCLVAWFRFSRGTARQPHLQEPSPAECELPEDISKGLSEDQQRPEEWRLWIGRWRISSGLSELTWRCFFGTLWVVSGNTIQDDKV